MADPLPTKFCNGCKQSKALADFGKHKRHKDGLQSRCKACHSASVKAYQERLGDEYKARKQTYDQQRWADGIRHDRSEWQRQNRARMHAKIKEWRRANPDKVAAYSRVTYARRKSGKMGGVGGAELAAWTEAQRKVCYWCGVRCADSFHIDHYVPLCRGGEHQLSNLVIACEGCNCSKNAKDPLDFAQEVGRLF